MSRTCLVVWWHPYKVLIAFGSVRLSKLGRLPQLVPTHHLRRPDTLRLQSHLILGLLHTGLLLLLLRMLLRDVQFHYPLSLLTELLDHLKVYKLYLVLVFIDQFS